MELDIKQSDWKEKLKTFIENKDEILEFNGLDHENRKQIHDYCEENGLYSVSKGNIKNRILIVSKSKQNCKLKLEELSIKSIEMIKKHFKLHLPCNHIEHFEYFSKELNEVDYINNILKLALDAINQYGETYFFFEEIPNFEKEILKQLEKESFFIEFRDKFPYENYDIRSLDLKIPKNHHLYIKSNFNQYYVSLDLSSANYQMLYNYNPKLVFNCKNWKEFVKTNNGHNYIGESKKLRLSILNKIYGKKMCSMWEFTILEACKSLIENEIFTMNEFIIFSSDEIIFRVEDFNDGQKRKKRAELLLSKIFPERKNYYKLESFYLKPISEKAFVIKEIFLNECDPSKIHSIFKGCNSFEYIQCYKYYYKLKLDKKKDLCCEEGKKPYEIKFIY
jgi:hypothetical protein